MQNRKVIIYGLGTDYENSKYFLEFSKAYFDRKHAPKTDFSASILFGSVLRAIFFTSLFYYMYF